MLKTPEQQNAVRLAPDPCPICKKRVRLSDTKLVLVASKGSIPKGRILKVNDRLYVRMCSHHIIN